MVDMMNRTIRERKHGIQQHPQVITIPKRVVAETRRETIKVFHFPNTLLNQSASGLLIPECSCMVLFNAFSPSNALVLWETIFFLQQIRQTACFVSFLLQGIILPLHFSMCVMGARLLSRCTLRPLIPCFTFSFQADCMWCPFHDLVGACEPWLEPLPLYQIQPHPHHSWSS